jgi:hypothetical protein
MKSVLPVAANVDHYSRSVRLYSGIATLHFTLGYRYLSMFSCLVLMVVALKWDNPSYKEPYRLFNI